MSQVAVAFYIPHSWGTVHGVTGRLIAWWTADVMLVRGQTLGAPATWHPAGLTFQIDN